MFEEMTDRIAGTLLMGLDAAVEFATLGEYRVVEADGPSRPYDHDNFVGSAPALPLVRRPERKARPQVTPDLLPKPATAVARATRPDVAPVRPAPKRVLPSAPRRRVGSPAPATRTAVRRKRGGEVPAGTQLCLFGR